MKKVYIVNLCVLLIIFLTAGITGRPNTDSRQMKEVISLRITALDRFYSQDESFDETRDFLETIESGRLLRNDVELMEAFAATDLDRIKSAKVKISACRRSSLGIIKGEADIRYVMEGQKGIWQDRQQYFFTAEDSGGKLKMTQFRKL
ncbi:MAG: hypothetical protein ACI4LA_08875 [Emergencia sp.]